MLVGVPHTEQDGEAMGVELELVVGVEELQHAVLEVDVDRHREPKQKS